MTARPNTHVVYFVGQHPCNKDGTEISKIKHQSCDKKHYEGLVSNHSFSSKPSEGYKDFYDKMNMTRGGIYY